VIYLARPIDQAGEDPRASRWATEASRVASESGVALFAPAEAFKLPAGASPDPSLERVNRAVLRECEGLLALMPGGVPTVGVPMEIEAALGLGLPVAVATDFPGLWSLQRDGITTFPVSVGPKGYTGAFESAVAWLELQRQTPAVKEPLVEELQGQQLRFQVADHGRLPTHAHDGDAGFDLYASETMTLFDGGFTDVPMGCSVELPRGYWGMLTGRSSTMRRRGLLVTQGIIDNGYRGPLFAGVKNLSGHPQTVARGERIAQLIPVPLPGVTLTPVAVSDLSESARGTNGFGSTGV
jgi:dUTP pyrophosphatase